MGQLVRRSADIPAGITPTDSPTADFKQLLAILVSFYKLPFIHSSTGSFKVKEKALEGLGLLFVAHPAALLEPAAIAAAFEGLCC